ncbi:microfibril-associated glycoprotein 4-like [Haematobia irritans]|uniref:microfibril-associated glycoprotein 4-like n=1 Tax=Haematobia irritans TaxID=7368 RepID=UPI003F5058C9
MCFMFYLCFILILWHQCMAGEADECTNTDWAKEEIELYSQLFLRLNSIIKSNIELQTQMLDVKDEMKQLKKLCTGSESTPNESDIFSPLLSHMELSNEDPIRIDGDINSPPKRWTTILRRIDGTQNFDRIWLEYKNGFGNISGEFFIGLEKLYAITMLQPHELLIVLKDFNNEMRYARYDHFIVGSEEEEYPLKNLGKYEGTAGDALSYHNGGKFSTKDRDNDDQQKISCAQKFGGGWWYRACHESNLNGQYVHSDHDLCYASGIHWKGFHSRWYSLKFAEMKVRPSHKS